MADVAEETKLDAVNGEQVAQPAGDEVTTGADVEVETEVKVDADKQPAEDASGDAEATTADAEQVDKTEGSHSPEQKRKEAPVSLSAHERHESKRPRRPNAKINSRFEDQPESNDADDIRRQVEFYFSDSNLPIDAYLLSQTGGHRNRPVDLKVIHNFKRMRHFQPFTAVRDAVKASNFLILNDNDEITRKVPLSEKFTDDAGRNRSLVHSSSMPRSIYAKGFGEEEKSTHLDIEAFFAPYGPLNSVRLRRSDDGLFKGSVFVEFESEDLQQQFLSLDPKPQWNGKDLEIMGKQEYVDMKHQGIIDGVVKPRTSYTPRGEQKGRGSGRRFEDRDRRGDRDRDDWRDRRDRDQQNDRRGGRGGRGRGRGGRGRGGRGNT